MIRVKSGRYNFFINGRRIYIKDNHGVNGSSLIQSKDGLDLTQYEYAQLIDDIYRRKIIDTNTLIERVYSSFKLVHTSRELK